MLTTFDLDEYVYAALRAGASGFLLKDARSEQLIGAVHSVARGDASSTPPSRGGWIQRVHPCCEAGRRPAGPGVGADPA